MATNNNLNAKSANIQSFDGTSIFAGRTLTGTTNQIALSNGTGVSADPVIADSPSVVITTQPCFCVRQSANNLDVTGDGTAFTMTFDGEIIDQGNNFSSPTFTAPNTAIYHFFASVGMGGLAAGNTQGSISITKNSTTVFQRNINPFAVYDATIANSTMSVEGVVNATANDTFQVIYIVSGGTKVVDVNGGATRNIFCGKLVY